MAEEQENNEEFDPAEVENQLKEIISDNPDDEPIETDGDGEEQSEEDIEAEDDFDVDSALDGFEPISLEGKISDDEAREKAIERGWREDGVDKYGHRISAIEFLERAPFFRKFELMRNDIDAVKKQNEKLAEQSKQIAKKAIEDQKKLVEGFKAEKERLLAEDVLDKEDITKLKDLDDKINSTPVEEYEEQDDEIVERYTQAKEEWASDHEWYGKNRAMTVLADKVGVEFAQSYMEKHGVLPEPEVTFKHVMEEVKKDFPDDKPVSRVASRQNRTVANRQIQKKKSITELPEDMQPVAKMVMQSTGMSEEEYMNTYEKNRG